MLSSIPQYECIACPNPMCCAGIREPRGRGERENRIGARATRARAEIRSTSDQRTRQIHNRTRGRSPGHHRNACQTCASAPPLSPPSHCASIEAFASLRSLSRTAVKMYCTLHLTHIVHAFGRVVCRGSRRVSAVHQLSRQCASLSHFTPLVAALRLIFLVYSFPSFSLHSIPFHSIPFLSSLVITVLITSYSI